MSSPLVIKIGNTTVNVAQFLYAEYSDPVKRSAEAAKSSHSPADAKPGPRPASLKITFVGGSTLTFYGDDAEDLRSQIDILPNP
jgi:hypothetical protein